MKLEIEHSVLTRDEFGNVKGSGDYSMCDYDKYPNCIKVDVWYYDESQKEKAMDLANRIQQLIEDYES